MGRGGGEMREVVKVEEARVRNTHLTTPTLEMKDTLIDPLHSILRCQTEAETKAVCGPRRYFLSGASSDRFQ